PEPGLGRLDAQPLPVRRPWVGAVAAGAVVVAAVGAIALLPRGDDPVGPASAGSVSSVPTTTLPSPTIAEVTAPNEAVTDSSTPIAAEDDPAGTWPGILLADESGITAVLSNGLTRELTARPAIVAYGDGQGGIVFQEADGNIARITRDAEEIDLGVKGDLQQVSDDPERAAIVIVRNEAPDTDVFESQVIEVELDTGEQTVLMDRGGIVRYFRSEHYVVLTTAAEESTGLIVLRDGAEIFSTSELSGGVIRGAVVEAPPQGRARVAYARNDLANGTSTVVIQSADGSDVRECPLAAGLGMWLDLAGETVAVTFGDGVSTFGFGLVDAGTCDVQQPPFPGTVTFPRGPVPMVEPPATAAAPGDGWRVVGVPGSDFLNVRAGPGAQFDRIGRLLPDDADVNVTGQGFTDLDGTGWYEVRLEDVVGFASSEFLAPPAAWEVGFDELACGGSSGVFGESATTPAAPETGTIGTVINGWGFVEGGNCARYVIVLGSGGAFDGSLVPADHVPGGLEMSATDGRVTVTLEGVTEVEPIATNALFDGALGLIVQPANFQAPLEARLLRSTPGVAAISVLSNPARLVIDVRDDPDGGPDAPRPVVGDGLTLLEGPVDPTGAGVTSPVTVVGYARWFEAQGMAEVTIPDGSRALVAVDGPSVQGVTPAGAGSVGVTAAWSPTWGEFVLEISAEPGDYELFVGEACLVDEANDVWEPCGVTQRFTFTG
ncbi:MAG: hypothetical protein OEM97_08695, partial [Acidimicrobiia bacterium]|nr:hypothetical protein [Acidimicrobiia bacterium]